MRVMRVAISSGVLDSGDPFATPSPSFSSSDSGRMARAIVLNEITKDSAESAVHTKQKDGAKESLVKEYDAPLFDSARQDAATWSDLNPAPHLSAIIQFRGALSSHEDENDDDGDAGFFLFPLRPSKIVIRAGATNAFGHIK